MRPCHSWWAQVRLTGDVDATAHVALAGALDELIDIPVTSVYVDLAAVAAADPTLLNFLVILRLLLPTHASLALCRPQPTVRTALNAAGINRVSTVRSDLPLLDMSPRRTDGTPGKFS